MELDNDTYVYGVINNKHIRMSKENWMDVWSWRENKSKPSYWFKHKPNIQTNKDGYKFYKSVNDVWLVKKTIEPKYLKEYKQ